MKSGLDAMPHFLLDDLLRATPFHIAARKGKLDICES
jgi:hypothetical protein